ncbi:oxidoreductase [Acinetobacter johnsonii]|uniref:NADP-dependent 3-hydroxy acid dehydrogenase YdfG n=1 Tax=Acinetobacter johnsonii TaxID=40214 RepID=A0A1R7QDS2_ACIJO|nr:oxidoreductase [Acinetobacter johnsonii]SJX22424.1 NADP-dependent 3-hydroxy acid dehydrogenase YdfG [Acinetobacter johnsonii]
MKNKVVLITGASLGIGYAIAEKLYQAGYIVYGTSRKVTKSHQSFPFKMINLDVTQDHSVKSAVQKVIDLEGHIDVLINNAGFAIAPAAAEESSMAQAQSIFNTNFFGMVRMTQAVIPHMRQQGCGQIINIGSVMGFFPLPYWALYSSTKHAIRGYSEALSHELRSQNIHVSVIEPAQTKTSLDAHLLEADLKIPHYDTVRAQQRLIMEELMEKSDDPSIVANKVLLVISKTSPNLNYTTGKSALGFRLVRQFIPSKISYFAIQKGLKLSKT